MFNPEKSKKELMQNNIKEQAVLNIKAPLVDEIFYDPITDRGPVSKRIGQTIQGFLIWDTREQETTHLMIYGGIGCGKTKTVQYIKYKLKTGEDDFEDYYVNCLYHNNSYRVMKDILGIHKRIDKTKVKSLFDDKMENHKKNIIVLDEVDEINDKEILYSVSRDHDNTMIIMITNKKQSSFNFIDRDVKSSLDYETISFPRYQPEDITKILRMRARAGLEEYDEKTLIKLAGNIYTNYKSDIRVAVRTLRKLFLKDGEPKSHNQIESALVDEKNNLIKENIRKLEAQQKYLLFLIYCYKEGIQGVVKLTKILESAQCHMSRSYLFNHLDEFQSMEFVDVFKEKKLYHNKRGATKVNKIIIPDDVRIVMDQLHDSGFFEIEEKRFKDSPLCDSKNISEGSED